MNYVEGNDSIRAAAGIVLTLGHQSNVINIYFVSAPHTIISTTNKTWEFCSFHQSFFKFRVQAVKLQSNELILGYQTSDSVSSLKFHHLALLVALVLHKGDSVDFNFAIL